MSPAREGLQHAPAGAAPLRGDAVALSLRSWIGPLIWFAALLLVGWGANAYMGDYPHLLFLLVAANIILALSLNLVSGFTGQFSLGHAGFMSLGGYTSAYLAMAGTKLALFSGPFESLNYILFAIAGGAVAAFAGLLVGLPSLRLKGDYLAIVTLGFGEIIRVILLNTEAVGAARGLYGIPSPEEISFGDWEITPFMLSVTIASFWVLVTFVVHWRLVHSTHGRAFMSVREDEVAAESMGIDCTQTKVRAFVLSSFFAGVAGSIYAHAVHYLNPTSFDFTRSVQVIIMVVLGGMGSLTGSIVAAIFVTLFPELALRPFQEWLRSEYHFPDVDLRMVIFASALILFMILRPQGIFGSRELVPARKKA